jgi:hypothetical protein
MIHFAQIYFQFDMEVVIHDKSHFHNLILIYNLCIIISIDLHLELFF